MKTVNFLPLIMAGSMLLVACGGSSGGGDNALIDPSDQPEDLAKVLGINVDGGTATVLNQKMEPIPPASNDANAPTVALPEGDVASTNNSEQKVDIQINSETQPSSLFAKIIGADTYAKIDLPSGQSKIETPFSLAIQLPNNLRDGRFCIEIKVQDSNDLVSANGQTVCYSVNSDQDDGISDDDNPDDGSPDDGNPSSPDNTALVDQTWRFTTTVVGSFNNQPVNQTISTTEVTGLEVPQDESANEVQSEDLSEAYAQALQQGCENGFDENAPTRFDNFSYTTNGNGGVGTVIEGGVELFVDGTCKTNDGDVPFMIDATIGYTAERLS